jgi:hypothetical protein
VPEGRSLLVIASATVITTLEATAVALVTLQVGEKLKAEKPRKQQVKREQG